MRLRRSATTGLALAGLAAPAAFAQEPSATVTETAAPVATPSPIPTATQTPTKPPVLEVEPKPELDIRPKPTQAPIEDAEWPQPDQGAEPDRKPKPEAEVKDEPERAKGGASPGGEADGVPAPPAGWTIPAASVSAAALDAFRIPPFLLPIYQAAGIQYGVRWEILAAINEIETNNGLNLNVSSAGALGWMQFMPSSWRAYGVDANGDGLRDPYNPVDAIFAAARYLKAAGAATDIRAAVFAYNHADWYVEDVLRRAREIAALPAPLVGALTGLAQGRVPVAAPARMARGRASDRFARLRTRSGAAAIAVVDGRVTRIGRSARLGRYLELEDVYGNLYTYAHLGTVAATHPVPRRAQRSDVAELPKDDPAPTLAATRHPASDAPPEPASRTDAARRRGAKPVSPFTSPDASPKREGQTLTRVLRPNKERLFANPGRRAARRAGGTVQLAEAGYDTPLKGAVLKLNSRDYSARPLQKGSRVLAGTILGRIGAGTDPHLRFEIRPAGMGAPRIDPKPIIDGWRLLQSTAVYRNADANADALPTIGQALLLGKPALQRMVLSDPRLEIYDCGRRDIRIGAVDRRVLATLAFLADSGMNPAVSSLRCGHSFFTASGNVSEHSSGNAVDIYAINGTPILGNQGPGSVTDRAVKALLTLQGPMSPHQIITLMDYEGAPAAFSASDHADHIHVGFHPEASDRGGSAGGAPTLAAGTWPALVRRLAAIEQPTVPTRPSRYALRVG